MLAVTSNNVAYAAAIAGIVAAITGPVTAWLVVVSTHRHDERMRYDDAAVEAYLGLLRAVYARGERLQAAQRAVVRRAEDSHEMVERILGPDAGEYLQARSTFEMFASSTARDSYARYQQVWGKIQDDLLAMTFQEGRHGENATALFRAGVRNTARVADLRNAMHSDVALRYAGSAKRRERALHRVRREAADHGRAAEHSAAGART